MSNLPRAKLRTTSSLVDSNGKKMIRAKIEDVGSSVAFAVCVQAIRSSDSERTLPALMSGNYFILLKGESKDIEIEFDSDLLSDGNHSSSVIPYNKQYRTDISLNEVNTIVATSVLWLGFTSLCVCLWFFKCSRDSS